MAESDVHGALLVAAKTFLVANSIPATAISWPNEIFDPAGKAKWAAVHYMPADVSPVTAGALGEDREVGILQIDMNVPMNTGDSVFRSLRNAARAYFISGKTFTQSGQSVRITGCDPSAMRVVDNWFRLSLSVTYRAEFNRSAIT